jgi:hypothetical protein
VGRHEHRFESDQSPYVAWHPSRPEVVAIAVNKVRSTDTDPFSFMIDVYVSEDAGATWHTSSIPRAQVATPPGYSESDYAGTDPSVAFDPTGVLHVGAMAAFLHPMRRASSNTLPFFVHANVFHTKSTDLGRSWSTPVIVSQGPDPNRPWLSTMRDGSLFLSWRDWLETGHSSLVAWSHDGGVTWTSAELKDCGLPSRVVDSSGQPFFACSASYDAQNDTTRGFLVVAIDVENASMVPVSHLPEAADQDRPLLAAVADGSLALMSRFPAHLTRSTDGGKTWADLMNLASLMVANEGADRVDAYWLEADPWGGLHVVARPFVCHVPRPGTPCLRGAWVWLSLDAASSLPRGEQVLWSPTDVPTTSSASAVPTRSDEFQGIGFRADKGLLAWTRERGIDFATVRPREAPPR